jgi:hypothetical protein
VYVRVRMFAYLCVYLFVCVCVSVGIKGCCDVVML